MDGVKPTFSNEPIPVFHRNSKEKTTFKNRLWISFHQPILTSKICSAIYFLICVGIKRFNLNLLRYYRPFTRYEDSEKPNRCEPWMLLLLSSFFCLSIHRTIIWVYHGLFVRPKTQNRNDVIERRKKIRASAYCISETI